MWLNSSYAFSCNHRKTQFPESPTAGVYDIANTSSRLIILNNANKARVSK